LLKSYLNQEKGLGSYRHEDGLVLPTCKISLGSSKNYPLLF